MAHTRHRGAVVAIFPHRTKSMPLPRAAAWQQLNLLPRPLSRHCNHRSLQPEASHSPRSRSYHQLRKRNGILEGPMASTSPLRSHTKPCKRQSSPKSMTKTHSPTVQLPLPSNPWISGTTPHWLNPGKPIRSRPTSSSKVARGAAIHSPAMMDTGHSAHGLTATGRPVQTLERPDTRCWLKIL